MNDDKKYNDFIEWFRQTHPALKKYECNFNASLEGKAIIANVGNLTDKEYNQLLKIIHSFYYPVV